MAEPRAVVDVVRTEAGAHELLEEIGLFIRPFRRAETGERARTVLIANSFERAASECKRFIPRRFAEHGAGIRWIDGELGGLRNARPANQWLCETMRMADIVETESAFDA